MLNPYRLRDTPARGHGRRLLKAWRYHQAQRAARGLASDEVLLVLQWAILQIAGCLTPAEAALAPILPYLPFRRAKLPRWPRYRDPVAVVNRELAAEEAAARAAAVRCALC